MNVPSVPGFQRTAPSWKESDDLDTSSIRRHPLDPLQRHFHAEPEILIFLYFKESEWSKDASNLHRPPDQRGCESMDEPRRRILTLATMCIATFMAILDTTVVNLGLHAIQGDLHVSLTVLQWVLDIYNLVYAGFILTGGVLGDLFGRRRVFSIGIALFTLGSLICALAPNATLLICGGSPDWAQPSSFPERSPS